MADTIPLYIRPFRVHLPDVLPAMTVPINIGTPSLREHPSGMIRAEGEGRLGGDCHAIEKHRQLAMTQHFVFPALW